MYFKMKNGVKIPSIGFGTSLIEGKECVENIVTTYHPACENGTDEKTKAYKEQIKAMATK